MPSSTNPNTPRPCGTHTTGPDADPRPHVAALLTLAALGWYVTAIRPDLTAPVLWTVTGRRFDAAASITVVESDLDDALEELVHYASADQEPDLLNAAARTPTTEGPEAPSTPDVTPD